MRKLFLHVGVHRTGTTSTQKVLSENFQGLLQRGYLYPYGTARHDDLVRKVWWGRMTAADWAADLVKRADSHKVPVDNVILSDEDMSMVKDFRMFRPFADHFDVKVVVMLRRQDLWLESWYLQNVKWQWDARLANLSFDEFLEKRQEFHWIDYGPRLAMYEEIFGPGSVIPGVFERDDMPDGPTAAVLRLMGIKDVSFAGPEVHQNSSLSPLMSEFIRHLPLSAMKEGERRHFEIAAQKVDRKLGTKGSRLILSADQRRAILDGYAAGNAEVAQKYLGRADLFREPVPDADAPLAARALPADPGQLIAEFFVPMVTALGAQFAESRERMEQVQRSLEEMRRLLNEATQVKKLPERA